MAQHLTPTELAREFGLPRREVISRCMELGVPIFEGRIDQDLFARAVGQDVGRSGAVVEPSHFTLLDGDGNLIESFDNSSAARARREDILRADPDAEGHVFLVAYDQSGHPVGDLTRRRSPART